MAKITYDDKVAINPQPEVANQNKVTDSDMNEIKNSVNTLYDFNRFLETETQIGTWIDGKPIYRKVISVSNIGTAFSTTINNIDNLFFANKSRISWDWNIGSYPIDRADFYFQKSNNTIQAQNNDISGWDAILVLEYTKTTD